MTTDRDVPYGSMVLVPGIITLAVTLLRLTGERLGWSKTLFNAEAGGGGAVVGIVWLIPIFGILFAVQLARMGHGPSGVGKALGLALAGFAVNTAAVFAVFALKLGFITNLWIFCVTSLLSIAIAWNGWPALAKALLAYGFAARLPVAAVMLVAMLGDWKTHYDLPPPDFPPMGVLPKFLLIGLLPQMTVWIYLTIVGGMIFGAIAYAVAGKRAPAGA